MKFPEQFRWAKAPMGYESKEGDDFGFFIIPPRHANGRELKCMAVSGDEMGWDHVSISLPDNPSKCPSWNEMCIVKSLFWGEQEAVIQFHPPKSEHINNHAGCLHLWRYTAGEIPLPPSICVGIKDTQSHHINPI